MRRLIIRPGAIGDFVVSLPALESLSSAYTEVWTTAVNAPLVRFADGVDSIVGTGLDALELGPAVLGRLAGFEEIVSWYGTNRPDFQRAVSHLPFTFHTAIPPQGCGQHAVDYYLSQVGAATGAMPRLPVRRREERFAVIHPFSGGKAKNWPLDRFRGLAAHLPYEVRWTAGPEEELEGATRLDDLWSLAEWLAGAAIFIGNDSGITHLAAACGVPVLALFGPTDPNVWAPRGSDVQVIAAPDGRMESIAMAEVLATCEGRRRRP